MKSGANRTDQNRIKKMVELGHTAEDISRMLQIPESVVVAFSPVPEVEEVEEDED